MQKIKHGGITVKEGSVAIWDQVVHQKARLQLRLTASSSSDGAAPTFDTARERRQESRTTKDVLIGIPAAVVMIVVPGSALLLAVALKWVPFLLPSTYMQARGALRASASVRNVFEQIAAAATATPAALVSSDIVHRLREQISSELLQPSEESVRHLLQMLRAPAAAVSTGQARLSSAAGSTAASAAEGKRDDALHGTQPHWPLMLCSPDWLSRSFGLIPHIPFAEPVVEAAAAAATPVVERDSALVPSAGTMLLSARQLAARIAVELCERATAATQALAAEAEAFESSAASAAGRDCSDGSIKRQQSGGSLFVLPPRLTAAALSASGGAATFSELAAFCSRLAQDDWLLRREVWLRQGVFAGLPADDAAEAPAATNAPDGAVAQKPLDDKHRSSLQQQLRELRAVCVQRFLLPVPTGPAAAASLDDAQLTHEVRRLQRGLQSWLLCSATIPLPLLLELSHHAVRGSAASSSSPSRARPAVPLSMTTQQQ